MKRFLLVLFIAAFAISTVYAAGRPEKAAGVTRERVDVLIPHRNDFTTILPQNNWTINDNPWVNWLRDRIDIDVQFEVLPSQGADQRIGVLFASGDVPDLLVLPGGMRDIYAKLAEEDALLALDDLLAQYGPRILSTIEDHYWRPLEIRGVTYSIPQRHERHGTRAFGIRSDWMEEAKAAGFGQPRTVEEFYQFMRFFRQTKNVSPMTGTNNPIFQSFAGAFGVAAPFVEKNGRVVYTLAEPEAKEYLTFMHRLYSERLLDNEFGVNTGPIIQSKIVSGDAGMADMPWWDMKWIQDAFNQANVPVEIIWTEYVPVGPRGQYGITQEPLYKTFPVVPADAKNPAGAVRFADWMYLPEVDNTIAFGFEGDHWEMRNGARFVLRPEVIDWTVGLLLDGQESFPDRLRMKGFGPWYDHTTTYAIVEDLSFAAPSMDNVNARMPQINDHMRENFTRFIMGSRPIAQFDQYVNELNALGLRDVLSDYNNWFADFR